MESVGFNIVGIGHIGATVGSSLIRLGHSVSIEDPDNKKIERFIADNPEWKESEYTYWNLICVETPVDENGECDYSIVKAALQGRKNTVVLSTLFPGNDVSCDIYHPVFLKRYSSYIRPDRIILAGDRAEEFWKDVGFSINPTIVSRWSAEWIKLVHSGWSIMKVSFSNEMKRIMNASNDAAYSVLRRSIDRPTHPGKPFEDSSLGKTSRVLFKLGFEWPEEVNENIVSNLISLCVKAEKPGIAGMSCTDDMRDNIALRLMKRFPNMIGYNDCEIDSHGDSDVEDVLKRKVKTITELDQCDFVIVNMSTNKNWLNEIRL